MENDAYGISRWGDGLIGVLTNGNVCLHDPLSTDGSPVDLAEVIQKLERRGIQTPVLLRVSNFLEHRIRAINEGFRKAIEQVSYQGDYRGVFPIKVNQQAHVVERVSEYGEEFYFGLEVGSKAELLIALSQNIHPQGLIICNGYKDSEFIRLALLSTKLGMRTVIVMESVRELRLIIKVSRKLGIPPTLGVRVKLANVVSGNWAATSGDRSSFGLSIAQVMEVVETLRNEDLLDCLVLQHSHLGSQVPNMVEIRKFAQEASRLFIEIAKLGANLKFLDLGGGLGVDYTGENSSSANSINYSLEEYCYSLVETVGFEMNDAGVSHPCIVTESGRACVAQSSMLIFSVLESTSYERDEIVLAEKDDHPLLRSLIEISDSLERESLLESLNEATYYRDELRALFRRGRLSLPVLARAERAHQKTLGQIRKMMDDLDEMEWSDELNLRVQGMADIYHCNFSLFQSLPDVWAIDQLHPIIPITRLHEKPDRNAVLCDVTCDSDGRIDRFVVADGVADCLPLHSLNEDEEYYLGAFFVGAYQETLGDLHNLFGDTNVVTIRLKDSGDFEILDEVEGDTVSQVLSYVEYEPKRLLERFKARAEDAVKEHGATLDELKELVSTYRESLQGYTYYESD
ncbi:MAG: biosynthetic arginine decarboxylase [Opitutales bacterium]|nr:biosynthetic arginine decarboxylase [Opitutales bacterium]